MGDWIKIAVLLSGLAATYGGMKVKLDFMLAEQAEVKKELVRLSNHIVVLEVRTEDDRRGGWKKRNKVVGSEE